MRSKMFLTYNNILYSLCLPKSVAAVITYLEIWQCIVSSNTISYKYYYKSITIKIFWTIECDLITNK